ncbi:GPI ethanolamine phosphate transferase 2 [Sergentomyia squamirostris]
MKISTILLLQMSSFLFGLAIFMHGFLPMSFSSTEKADFQDFPKNINEVQLDRSQYKARFSRTIIMLIDAFRMDFLEQEKNMPHLRKLLKNGEACMVKLNVQPPTVTMPRIKALTSGTIPSFIDVILNLGSSEVKTDTFLQQLNSNGGRLIFYGDSTWTRMFPDVFHRKGENQDPLFVSDFYEGDKNITKHLGNELKHPDWKMMILHYLGLDHIGHAEGPFSSKIPGKLKEMDEVASKIVFEMTRWNAKTHLPALFFVTGDHGMRDTGGHGGSSAPEITVPLVAISTNCSTSGKLYNQIDFAATLSVLLGLAIPSSSIGNLIPELLVDLSAEELLLAQLYNGERLLNKLRRQQNLNFDNQEFFLQHNEARELHKEYIRMKRLGDVDNSSLFKRARLFYFSSAQEMSDLLAKDFVKYDLWSIFIGLLLTCLVTIATLLILFIQPDQSLTIDWHSHNIFGILIGTLCLKHFPKRFLSVESTICTLGFVGNIIILIAIIIVRLNIKLVVEAVRWKKSPWIPKMHRINFFAISCTIFHSISYSSSSFIEEEHQLWYYFGMTLFLLVFITDLMRFKGISMQIFMKPDPVRRHNNQDFQQLQELHSVVIKYLLLFLAHIFIRRLNQTGDKWLSVPDLGDWFIMSENKVSLSWFFFCTLLLTVVACGQFCGILTGVLTFTAILLIYYFRTVSGQVRLATVSLSDSKISLILFWINLFEIAAINYIPIVYRRVFQRKRLPQDGTVLIGASITIFCLISSLLHKPHNAILNVICIFTCQVIRKSLNSIFSPVPKTFMIVLSHLWIGKMFFFYQGNSNSLASIDLNAGYVGLSSFNMTIVGLFITINTYSGPLLTLLVMLYHLQEDQNSDKYQCQTFLHTTSLFLIFPLSIYLIAATGFRNHLFVWTVFSPKLLYEAFNFGLFHVIFTVLGVTWCRHKA